MSTSVSQPRELTKPVSMGSRSAGPLLVATDASGAADGAIRVAKAIAQRAGQPIYILAVHPPMPILSAEIAIAEGPNTEAENRRYLREQVLEQLKRVGVEAEWPLDVVTGDPAATIVSVAQGIGASLVIMGLGGHGLFDRLLGDETVLRVLRLGTVPVLAVAPDAIGLPRNALAAIDFSASCERAASLAADIMSPDGRLTLIHVVTREDDKAHLAIHHSAYDGILGHGFDLLTADIGFEAVEQIDRRVLSGDPAKVLLDLADAMTPDLIVAGSHGHRFLTRLLLGSVSQRLVRGARCSVLVAPPADAPSYLQELPRVSEGFASYAWAERLEEFTRRNAGRTSALEVIEPELGAQVEHRGLAFRGASFDPRDGQVHLMFGELGSEKAPAHLTRRIGGVTAIQVLRDRECQDMLLRIAHGRGQTLLTLVR